MKQTNYILQAAVAAALGVTGAQAATFSTANPTFAKEVLANATSSTVVTLPTAGNNTVVIQGSEGYINRLQPLNVKVQLNGGVKFAGAIALSTGFLIGTFDANGGFLGTGGVNATVATLPVTIVGGGASGDTFVTFSVDPTGTGLKKGGLNLGALTLKGIDTTLKTGAAVTADVSLIDPTTGNTLETLTSKTIATAASAVSFSCAAETSPKKIEVTGGSKAFDTATTTAFTAGTFAGTINTAYYDAAGALLTAASLTNVTVKVAGLASFDAFTATGVSVNGVAAATTVSTASGASVLLPLVTASVNGAVLFTANGTNAIEEGTATVQALSGLLEGVTGVAASSACSLATMSKNGYSAKFPLQFSSADAKYNNSYIRLVNDSNVAGSVWFTIKDSAGAVVSTTPVASPVAVAAKSHKLWSAAQIETAAGLAAAPAVGAGDYYRVEISSTLPTATTKTQGLVVSNGTIVNTTATQ